MSSPGKQLALSLPSIRMGKLTKTGIIITLLWVVLVNFIDRCQGERQREQLRNRPWTRSVDSLRVPTQKTDETAPSHPGEDAKEGQQTR